MPIPDAIGFVDAAAFPLTFLTAWHMLMTRARLQRGEDVLVLAAGSGVGQAAIQIARLHGARVFATAGIDEKLERARELGADEVINHHTQDVAEEIKRLTEPARRRRRGRARRRRRPGPQSVRSLARGGRLVTCGATTGHDGELDLRRSSRKQLSLLGSYMGTKGELLRAAQFFFAGRAEAGRSTGRSRWPRPPRRTRLEASAVRQDRARSVMQLQRLGVSLFSLIAVVSIVLAAATIWLFVTDPVTVATAVNEGEISPLVRELAQVLLDALAGC